MKWWSLSSIRRVASARAVVLSSGLVLLSLCLLLLADMIGLRGNANEARSEARAATLETLAVRLSLLASTAGPGAVAATIETHVATSRDILGAELVAADGTRERFGESGLFEEASTDRMVAIPIVADDGPVGELTLAFRPSGTLREDALYFGTLAIGLLATYLAYLGKVLVQLDPSRAIPERVDNAFNLLVEGVIVLDDRLHVLMVNTAAAAIVDKTPAELIGGHIDRWPWARDEHWQAPWTTVLASGVAIIDRPVHLMSDSSTNYTLNGSLIRDDDGRPKGVMLTLNDLSAMERKNRELSSTLQKLRRSQESITIKNLELEALASQDPLTGLKNRRSLVMDLGERLTDAIAQRSALACIMIDIDHFKRINDTLGHAVGDEVICAVANTLVARSRDEDTVGRIGGEEFVVVLPETTLAAAVEMAERIRTSIERLGDDVTLPVDELSASLGVATLEAGVDTIEELLDRADRALYVAKNDGRNRVMAFDAEAMGAASSPEAAADGATGTASPGVGMTTSAVDRPSPEGSERHGKARPFDSATDLPRREVFVERVESTLEAASRGGTTFALLSLALRDGEHMSTTLGHAASRTLLHEFAVRLQEGLRRVDSISEIVDGHALSRTGATEFGVLLEGVTDADEVLTVMTRVRRLFAAPIIVDGTRVHVGTCIGAAFFPRDGHTVEALMEQAGVARREAARQPERTALGFAGKGVSAPTRESLEMESDLYEAVERAQFSVHYQPKLELATQRICGMEALARWQHPEKGWISPAEFIPLAERNGLIEDVSRIVTETSLRQLARWHDAGFDELGLAMNVSATQLREPDLVPTVLAALDAAGVRPSAVEVELTETAVIESPQRARIALGQLRSAGIGVSMDDFGTGYTSLALLADLPLDAVKIDRSFVSAMTENDRSRAIVRSIVDMAHTLGLSVVGEGVETNEQLATLAAFGCNQVQGYLISRPLAAEATTAFLERQAHESRPRRRA